MEQAEKAMQDQQELKYKNFIDMLQSDAFAMYRAHMQIVQDKYKRDIVQFLRSSDNNQIVGEKARLAQQAIDIIENTFTTHVEDVKKDLNPSYGKREGERLEEQGGQVY